MKKVSFKTIKDLFYLLKQQRKILIGFTVFITFSSILESLGIGSLYPLVGILENNAKVIFYLFWVNEKLGINLTEHQFIISLLVGLLVIFIFRGIVIIISFFLQYKFSEKLKTGWQIDIFSNYLNREYSFFVKHKTGDLIQRQMTHTEMTGSAVVYVCEIARSFFNATLLFITLWFISWQGALSLMITMAIIVVISVVVSRVKIFVAGQAHAERQKEAYAIASEVIIGIRQVKAYLADKFFLKSFSQAVREKARLYVKNATLGQVPNPVMQTVVLIGLVSVLFYTAYYERNTAGLLPLVTVFGGATYRIIGSMSGINGGLMQITHLLPSVNIVADLIKNKPVDSKLPPFKDFTRSIIFENINFSYQEKGFRLNDLNIIFEKGKFYGIVGASGSGKSTLVDLIIKFYSSNSGKILVDGKNIEEIDTRSWREKIGLISQETFIFNGTIFENISFAVEASEVDQKKVVEAAKVADIYEMIEYLPDKFQTIVGERGLMLSGGQRQRLAIARAVYRDPQIYIFDEATSSLDVHSERKIQKSIEKLSRSKTVIAIAHRLSTVINADEILVMKEGRVVEKGTHQKLLAKGGYYSELYEIQELKNPN